MIITNARFCNALLLCFLIVVSGRLVAHNTLTISVYDSSDKHPLSAAVVRVSPLSGAADWQGTTDVTDKRGQLTVACSGPAIVNITHVGYLAVHDTVYDGSSKAYHLRATASNMEDVIVTGQYTPGTSRSSVYDVKVYTQQDFRDKGATNLREALLGSLNIDMTQDAVMGSGISLQGISGQGVKIMVDGVPLVGRINGNLDLSQVNLSNIERIEIVKGPMSSIYGTDAMGGVINLISKSNQAERFSANLRGYYESVGQYNAELNGGLNIGHSQAYISGGRNFFDGYSSVPNGRHQDWRPKEQYFANVKYVYTGNKFRIGATGNFLREMVLDRGNLQPNSTFAFDQHYLTYRPQGSIFSTVYINDLSRLDLFIAYSGFARYFNYYKKDLVTLQETLLKNQLNDTSVYHDIIGRATYTLSTANKKLSFQFGTDLNQEYTSQTLLKGQKHEMGDYAVFGSVKWKPVANLDIQPALRFGYNTRFQSPLIPSINVKYDFAEHFSLRAGYGMGYRAPSLYELYLDFHDTNHNLNGDSSLKAERGHSVQTSFTYRMSKREHRVSVTASGFFNKINNKIDLLLVRSAVNNLAAEYTYGNINNYMTAGGQLELEYAWKRFKASAGASYIWYSAQTVDPYTSEVNKTTIVSPDVSAKASYKIPKAEITINAFYKYSGPKLNFLLSNSVETGTRGGFHSLDISLARDFWHNRIQVTCGGKNLLNVTNVGNNGVVPFGHGSADGNTLVNWGRTFFISLNLHFAK